MSMSVDSPRGPRRIGRTRRTAERSEAAQDATPTNLPVAVEPPRTIPTGAARASGDTVIHAQVIGERRGLRAGPTIHDEARVTYNSVEWSGAKDRRAPKGRNAKTDV